jgi:hypothetical protein
MGGHHKDRYRRENSPQDYQPGRPVRRKGNRLKKLPAWPQRALVPAQGALDDGLSPMANHAKHAKHARLTHNTGMKVYFRDPCSPWQRAQ